MVIAFFIGLLLVGVPVAFVLALTALFYLFSSGNSVLLDSFPQQFYGGLENYGLLALPLFILVGECMNEGGIARRLMAMAAALLGSIRGGLAYINLLSNMMMASILGSTVAQITIMSRVAVPEMERAGYPRDQAVAITAAGGMLAPIIPPSMLFVIFGVIAQISIGDLFIAGILPGVLLGLAFFAVLGWMARRHRFPATEPMCWRRRLMALRDGLAAGLIPALIVGGILSGLATPTEAAALACLGSILVGRFVYKEFDPRALWPALKRTALSSSVVLILIAAANLFSWVITYENLPALAAQWIQAAAGSPALFLVLVTLALLVVGMILDPIPALILVVPVLLPVATGVYGISPFHFGVIVCLTLVMGLLTPPVGSALFTASTLSGVRAERLSLLLLPYLLVMLVVMALLIFFPFLTTALI
ncbi:TRAP transporter large permease [Alloalcanivorax sp. C16-2]|uniref:TRAP transporter large permease n=1 Tax=Alloalcanivorax TaxID=3020832 RepID=UPI0019339A94|nr:TRAP transporter large permease [Alloalcanivorax marinus]MBL7249370.1 TRAP transporter large permease [Alloalcanivorax marinus]